MLFVKRGKYNIAVCWGKPNNYLSQTNLQIIFSSFVWSEALYNSLLNRIFGYKSYERSITKNTRIKLPPFIFSYSLFLKQSEIPTLWKHSLPMWTKKREKQSIGLSFKKQKWKQKHPHFRNILCLHFTTKSSSS